MKSQLFQLPILIYLILITQSGFSHDNVQVVSSDNVQQQWVNKFNSNKEIKNIYLEKGGVFLDGKLYKGRTLIEKKIEDFKKIIGQNISYEKVKIFQLRDNQKFELGKYKGKEKTFYTVIGWKNNGVWEKELEVIYEYVSATQTELENVNNARNQWEELSNAHTPEVLVDNLFANSGYYFNGSRVFQGDEIKGAYSYMLGENWEIVLETLKSVQLSEDIVFDVGTFKSNGKGLYFLLWHKNAEKWELLLDFNF